MKVFGLTGGIACGKSTVSKQLKKLGAIILDADKIARKLSKPKEAIWQEYYSRYGDSILNKDETLNREAIGKIVFSDKNELEWINKTTHPIIGNEVRNRMDALEKAENLSINTIVFIDAPLLFEVGWDNMVEGSWVVTCGEAEQIKRLMHRNNFSEEEAKKRIASQMSLAEKCKRADVIIDNSGNFQELHNEVEKLWQRLVANVGEKV